MNYGKVQQREYALQKRQSSDCVPYVRLGLHALVARPEEHPFLLFFFGVIWQVCE